MAKRRAQSKRRAKKVTYQTAARKRSEPPADQLRKAVYSREALELPNAPAEIASEQKEASTEDVFGLSTTMAKRFAEQAAEQNARTFSNFIPPLAPPGAKNAAPTILREVLDCVTQQVHLNLQFFSVLPTSRTPQSLLLLQTQFAKGTSENLFEATRRICSIASQISAETGRSLIRRGRAT